MGIVAKAFLKQLRPVVIFKDKAIPACKVTARLSDEIVKSTPKQHSVWKIAGVLGSVINRHDICH